MMNTYSIYGTVYTQAHRQLRDCPVPQAWLTSLKATIPISFCLYRRKYTSWTKENAQEALPILCQGLGGSQVLRDFLNIIAVWAIQISGRILLGTDVVIQKICLSGPDNSVWWKAPGGHPFILILQDERNYQRWVVRHIPGPLKGFICRNQYLELYSEPNWQEVQLK